MGVEKSNPLASAAFRRWFESSPLREADGRPMVLYHGTTADIAAFDLSVAGSDGVLYSLPGIFATYDSELASDYAHNKLSRDIGGAMRELQRYKNLNPGEYGPGYEERYQDLQREFAQARQDGIPELGNGANVLPVYVSLQNPLVLDAGGRRFMEVIPDAVRQLTAGGHDGLIVENVIDHASDALKRPAKIVMALDPGQIKSAIGNDGSYDFANPDIRHSLAAVENFDEWFQGSKVSRRGRPVVMYHRTASDFEEFDTDRGDLGAHFGTAEQAQNLLGGHLRDGERTIPVYLSIKNPLRLSDKGGFHADAVAPQLKRAGLIDGPTAKRLADVGANGRVAERREVNREIKRILAEAGYDGIVYRNSTEGRGDSYIAFDTSQVVSAITSGPGVSAVQMATPDSVRAAIAQLVRVSADELAEGVGAIVVATSEGLRAAGQDEVPAQRDAALRAWFGDSKAVDDAGKPLVVYHGAPDARFVDEDGIFKSFDERYGGTSLDGGAHWFAADRAVAKTYAQDVRAFDYQNAEPGVVPAYLKMENPLVIDGGGKLWRDAQNRGKSRKLITDAKAAGHDGVIIRNVKDDYNNENGGRRTTDTYVVWRSIQIKSATDNRGSYDPRDPDIRHSLAAGAAGRDPRAQAFHDAGTNTTVFLADRIAAGQEAAVFLHETVHRHGRQALPEGRWDALVGQVKAWAQEEPQSPERAIHDAAAARVATAGVAGALADEELFAYAVEEAVARGIEPSAAAVEGSAEAWLQAVVESIQRISDKLLGNDLHELGGQDLVDLAYALAQLDSPEHGVEVRRAMDEYLEPSRLTATAEQSQAYAEAVNAGQRRQALRVLHAAAGIQLVDYSFDRGGAHDSPDPVNGAPMWDVSRGIYPEDLYKGRMHEYGTYSPLDADAFGSIRHADGRPNAIMTVYRAVEKTGPSKIQPGDWVTPSRGYAKEHGTDNISGPFKIISKMVHARDLFTDGNSILEWGYHPQDFLPEFPRSDTAKARSLQERLDALSGAAVVPEPQSPVRDGPAVEIGLEF